MLEAIMRILQMFMEGIAVVVLAIMLFEFTDESHPIIFGGLSFLFGKFLFGLYFR